MKKNILKWIDRNIGAFICRLLAIISNRITNSVNNINIQHVKKILLIRPGGIGDFVLVLPLMKAINRAYPDAGLDIICERRNCKVISVSRVKCNPLIYDSEPFKVTNILLRSRYDVAIDSEQFHHFSAIMSLMSGARIRIGFNINPRRNFLYTHLVRYSTTSYEGYEFCKLLKPLKITIEDSDSKDIFVINRLIPFNFNLPSNYIVISPDSSEKKKMWDINRFIGVATKLYEKTGYPSVFISERKNLFICNSVKGYIDLTGKTDFADTISIIAGAALFIGVDSGLSHVARLLDIPSVLIFGPSDPEKWTKVSDSIKVINKDYGCSPCSIFGYYRQCSVNKCMMGISIEDVINASVTLLNYRS